MKKILRAFKKLKKTKYYICDPVLARKCDKVMCWHYGNGGCKCTSIKAYSKKDDRGKPVIASDEDLYNMTYLEEKACEWAGRRKRK